MKKLIFPRSLTTLLIVIASKLAIACSPINYLQPNQNSSLIVAKLDSNLTKEVAQNSQLIDEKTALNLVWKLPQVQRKAREIQRLSRGTIKVAAIVDSSPTPDEPYYKIRVYEDEPDHNTTVYWFRVFSPGGTIEVLDVLENKYISLEEWRQQLRRRR